MKKKINKRNFCFCIFFFVAIVISIFALIKFENGSYSWIGIIVGAIGLPISAFWENLLSIIKKETWKMDYARLVKSKELKENDLIRISFAYLFRIKVNGKYLLVPNSRGIGKFQPVGGAYKCYDKEREFLGGSEFSVVDDDLIKLDETSKDDYRMRVPVKNFKRFMKRFDVTSERETLSDLSREFTEELLVSTKSLNPILNKKIFSEIKYCYKGRHLTGIEYSNHSSGYEILLADIIELMPNEGQLNEFINLQNKPCNLYKWAAEDEIECLGIHKGTDKLKETITDHTSKILQCNANNLTIKKSDEKTYLVEIK